ncbi:hypothetical protein BV25DRAFT_1993933 [Artomyces pyxidatus]|uniref:Uncharacterized protein n=1 Tax=Artomyces pyxidatus TaxID=48021 RepID=A0ACB8SR79_9AGAM|nr:hypothetical protein BV25DRAFT_1993933 [Artomyces pyxidatus]
MLFLFCMGLVQALGAVLYVKWAREGKVYDGSFCTTQGVIQQFGEAGVAMTTTAITVHTFVSVFWRVGVHYRPTAYGVVALIWTFVALFVGISAGVHRRGEDVHDTPTPVRPLLSPVLHVFPILTGKITGAGLPLRRPAHEMALPRAPALDEPRLAARPRHARVRLPSSLHLPPADRRAPPDRYPAVHSVLVLPLRIVRWVTFRTGSAPSAATFVVIFLFSLSGACNDLDNLSTDPPPIFKGQKSCVGSYREDDDVDMEMGGRKAETVPAYIDEVAEPVENVPLRAKLSLLEAGEDAGTNTSSVAKDERQEPSLDPAPSMGGAGHEDEALPLAGQALGVVVPEVVGIRIIRERGTFFLLSVRLGRASDLRSERTDALPANRPCRGLAMEHLGVDITVHGPRDNLDIHGLLFGPLLSPLLQNNSC